MHKMFSDGGRILARMGMRNKLFILHGLIRKSTQKFSDYSIDYFNKGQSAASSGLGTWVHCVYLFLLYIKKYA